MKVTLFIVATALTAASLAFGVLLVTRPPLVTHVLGLPFGVVTLLTVWLGCVTVGAWTAFLECPNHPRETHNG